MIDDLYDEVGPASFTVTWQHDPRGLLSAAVAFLADLRLLRPVRRRRPRAARRRPLPEHQAGPPGAARRGPARPGPVRRRQRSRRYTVIRRCTAMAERFKPSRAGVINVWDYVDEEWAFADGRLALRGHNGSGKTKALEVLFPFVLDGVADSRRLDPFSGENRTMKSNLLYRGQESEYGYVWMEFARARAAGHPAAPTETPAAETITLIIGMRAHRNSDGVRMSFFVTGKRLGVDFGLLSADSRPLTERQLRAVLEPDAWRRTATEYRDLVDHRLFGLGRERYAQLLDLLLALQPPAARQGPGPGQGVRHADRRPVPGRRGPGAAGGPRLREPRGRAEALRRPDGGQRGRRGVPRRTTRPTSVPMSGSPSTGCRPGPTRPPTTPSGWRRRPRPAAGPPTPSAPPRPTARPAGPRASASRAASRA